MNIIEIQALANGAHRNQNNASVLPEGWAVIPEDMVIPDTFPFVNIEVEDGVVISMTAGTLPEPDRSVEILEQIADLKAQLSATDYQAIKYAEGWINEEDYAPIKAQRQAIRDEINELEAQLASENTT